jgi:hypothetical protein
MKRVIVLSFIIALLTSCASKQRETELLGKISKLEKQLDDCQNGAEKLHTKMKVYFEKGEFQLCKNVYSEMEKRHPDSELYSEVKGLYEKIIKDEQDKVESERLLAGKKVHEEKIKAEKEKQAEEAELAVMKRDIQKLLDSGIIRQFNPSTQEASVNPDVWNGIEYNDKANICVLLAKYSGSVKTDGM